MRSGPKHVGPETSADRRNSLIRGSDHFKLPSPSLHHVFVDDDPTWSSRLCQDVH
jgi:hypothetical protein